MTLTPKKFSELGAMTALVGGEIIPGVQSGANKYLTPNMMKTFLTGEGNIKIINEIVNDDQAYQISMAPISAVPAFGLVMCHKNIFMGLVRSTGTAGTSYVVEAANSNVVGQAPIVAGANGNYTGTTGVDGEITFAASPDTLATLYLENRAGFPLTMTIILMG